jgi:hypothetical protein
MRSCCAAAGWSSGEGLQEEERGILTYRDEKPSHSFDRLIEVDNNSDYFFTIFHINIKDHLSCHTGRGAEQSCKEKNLRMRGKLPVVVA